MCSTNVVVTHVLGWSARPGEGPSAAERGAYVSRCTKFAFWEPRCKTSFAWAIADELSLTFELTPTDSNEKPPEGLGPFCSPLLADRGYWEWPPNRRVRSDLACHPAWPLLADSLPAVRRDLVRTWVPCTKCFLIVTSTV